MSTAYQKFDVGSKVYHQDYGEGMVVEVRPRQFFDILEVAFTDGVKRLTSNHPKISDRPPQAAEAAPGKKKRRRTRREIGTARAHLGTEADRDTGSDGAAADPEAGAETADETESKGEESPFGFQDDGILVLNQESVERLRRLDSAPDDGGLSFLRHLRSERLALTRGFEKLLSLSAVRDLEQYDFQIHAVLRVLRNFRGRAILADEVGLGKTIEAGLILKEYALRGLIRRALVLTPVSLMTQWREELRHKFDLPFEVHSRGQRWDAYPWTIASLDTAKTEKNRDDIEAAGFDILVVDEAHRLRNHLTQGWKFVDALSLKYLLLLTATPVQNDLRELYNLVTLLKPGHLGTYREFRQHFMVRGDKRLPKDPDQAGSDPQ